MWCLVPVRLASSHLFRSPIVWGALGFFPPAPLPHFREKQLCPSTRVRQTPVSKRRQVMPQTPNEAVLDK